MRRRGEKMRQNAHLTHSHYNSSPFPSLFHWTLIKMMYVRAWNPFHLPPVYYLLVWQMSAKAMMISLFTKKITYLWSRDMPWNREEDKEKNVQSDSVTSSRCSCSTFLFCTEKTHSDPDNWRNMQVPKHSFGLFCDSMSCVRLSELGQITIENLLKDFSLKVWNNVTQ